MVNTFVRKPSRKYRKRAAGRHAKRWQRLARRAKRRRSAFSQSRQISKISRGVWPKWGPKGGMRASGRASAPSKKRKKPELIDHELPDIPNPIWGPPVPGGGIDWGWLFP